MLLPLTRFFKAIMRRPCLYNSDLNKEKNNNEEKHIHCWSIALVDFQN